MHDHYPSAIANDPASIGGPMRSLFSTTGGPTRPVIHRLFRHHAKVPDCRHAAMVTGLPAPLQALAVEQVGLLTRRQLRRGGVTNARIRWAVGRRWQLVLPGVVATFTGRLDADQRLMAGSLYAGRDALLTGPVGARLHGVTAPWVSTYPLLTFLVPENKTNRTSGFVTVRRTQRPDLRPVSLRGIAVASAARCIADAARICRREDDARALTISALQRRVTSEDQLYAELLAGPVRFSAAVRAGIAQFQAGAWSISEVDLLRALAASRILPPVMPNPVLRLSSGPILPTPDGWIDEVGLAIQLHSRTYHSRDQDWDGTVMGDGELVAAGVTVIGVTPHQLRRDPEAFVRRVELAYLALRRRGGRPDVIAKDRHHHDVA